MESLEETLEGFEPDKSYFVENNGYDMLADIRRDLETALDYGEISGEGREYLNRGDQILVGLPEVASSPASRKNLVEAAVDHYRVAARETDQDTEYFEEELETALIGIIAGIDQIERASSRTSKTAEEAAELANRYLESTG